MNSTIIISLISTGGETELLITVRTIEQAMETLQTALETLVTLPVGNSIKITHEIVE